MKKVTEILTAHYTKTFDAYGSSSKGVDWGDQSKHHLRLRKILEGIGVNRLKFDSILDVGCGYGELLIVLRESGLFFGKYYGIDPCISMIDSACKKYPNQTFEAIALEDFTASYSINHVLSCGLLTKKLDATDDDMYALLGTLINKTSLVKAQTLTFNMMSPLCDIRPKDLFFPEIDRVIDLLKLEWGFGVKKLSITSDYLPYEMLIHIEI